MFITKKTIKRICDQIIKNEEGEKILKNNGKITIEGNELKSLDTIIKVHDNIAEETISLIRQYKDRVLNNE